MTYDLIAHLFRQKTFSEKTFGPGTRLNAIKDHLEKELKEVIESNGDLSEWIDIILLGLDGAWRSGASPEQIAQALYEKLIKNENRIWPDWRLSSEDVAIEHIRDNEES